MSNLLRTLSLAGILTCAAGGILLNAEDPPPPQEQNIITLEELEDGKLAAFVVTYMGIIDIAASFEAKFRDVGDDPEEAARLQQEANKAMIQVIEDEENIDLQEYNTIVVSMRHEEPLREAIHAMVRERQGEDDE